MVPPPVKRSSDKQMIRFGAAKMKLILPPPPLLSLRLGPVCMINGHFTRLLSPYQRVVTTREYRSELKGGGCGSMRAKGKGHATSQHLTSPARAISLISAQFRKQKHLHTRTIPAQTRFEKDLAPALSLSSTSSLPASHTQTHTKGISGMHTHVSRLKYAPLVHTSPLCLSNRKI